MVTVILAFIFLTPRGVFKDSPNSHPQHPNQIVVRADGANGFIYELAASSLGSRQADKREALKQALEPVAGNIEIERYEEVHNWLGKVTGYRVWVRRPGV